MERLIRFRGKFAFRYYWRLQENMASFNCENTHLMFQTLADLKTPSKFTNKPPLKLKIPRFDSPCFANKRGP